MRIIYIRLLDEGTEVFRPTEAEELADGCFKLLPTIDYDPDDEHWEFAPGSIVRGVNRKQDGDEILVAVSSDYDGGKNGMSV